MHLDSHRKKNIVSAIKEYLSPRPEVVFSYLFGSFLNSSRFGDIDIGIFFNPDADLLQLGSIQSQLNGLSEYKVDMAALNKIPNKSPAFAYEIVTKGELIVNKHPDTHILFKTEVYRRYFDTAYLRRSIDQAFTNRLESNKFGARNYE